MKTLAILMGLTLSTSVFANQNQYTYKIVPHEEIDQYLVPGSDATGTPEALQGLWWLDGNPVHDEVISFAGAQFQPIEEAGKVVGYEAFLPVYDEGVWSWHNDVGGWRGYIVARKVRLTYHLVFDANFTSGDITPVVKLLPGQEPVEIPQSFFASFTMDLVNNNEWSRDTAVLGSKSNYRFRRIVDGEGTRLPNFEDYLANIKVENLKSAMIPVCTLPNPTGQLPSPCAAL